jgi:serine/threonine-protein kinase
MEHIPLRGQVIANRYEITDQLEDRGYSALYKGKDRTTGATVLLRNTPSTSNEARARFEAVIAHPIEHPNLARRLHGQWYGGFGTQAGNGSWEVFEWIDGPTLESWLRTQDTLPEPREAVTHMIEVCRALETMHHSQLRLYHQHITPAAVKLWTDGDGQQRAIVYDYGTTYDDRPIQLSSAVLTTNQHPAPEQYRKGDTANERTDVLGIGETLYKLVTGHQPPLIGYRRQHNIVVARADILNSRVSRSLADVIQRAMAVRPEDRFASVTDLRIALTHTLRPQSNNTTDGGSDGFGFVALLAVAAIVAVIALFINGNDSPTVSQPTPLAIGGGGLPAAVPFTPAPTVPPTATPDIVATLAAVDARLVPIAGPLAGELPTTAADASVAQVTTSVADFAIEAVFVNPDAPTWDYGFMFRHSLTGHYRLSVASDGTWLLIYRQEDPNNPGFSVNLPNDPHTTPLALGAGETNHLRLLVVGPYGTVTINGHEVAKVGLWNKVEAGDTYIAAGLRGASNGTAVTYRDLFVRGPQ